MMVKYLTALLLMVCVNPALAFETTQVSIPSASMNTSYPATVVLPDTYSLSNKSYPVVYLLHGYGSNYQSWAKNSEVEAFADQRQLTIVMPDGNVGSWYIDSPVKPNSRFETYIYQDVISHIDKHYRSIKQKNARAISGFSMGGFGALNIALNHSTLFGAAGSISGGVDPRPFQQHWQLSEVFGSPSKTKSYWDSRAIINNSHRFLSSALDVTLDCGVDDFFIATNRALRQKLLELNIAHDYSERPGGHNWNYWRRAIKYQMLFFADGFDHKLKR